MSGQAAIGSVPETFEVATIKLGAPDARGGGLDVSGNRFIARNATLKALVQFAYTDFGSDDQIIGGPGWIESARFDVQAKVDQTTAERLAKLSYEERVADMRPRVGSPLVERFRLKVHAETRTMPLFILTVAKGGPKMKPSVGGSKWSGIRLMQGHSGASEISWEASEVDMNDLTKALARVSDIHSRHVIDQTHLLGKFDFTFRFTPEAPAGGDGDSVSDAAAPSLFVALSDQLGLVLAPSKGAVSAP